MKPVADYVILGAGSAGCVLTNRLLTSSLKTKPTVALVEAGPSDEGSLNSWQIKMPAALTYSISDTKYNWDYYTTKQKNLNNRRLHQPRGRVLGGSSSINAMVYIRGHAMDFERWAQTKPKGEDKSDFSHWKYSNVLPYFKRAQSFTSENINSKSRYRGYEGPLKVRAIPEGSRNSILYDEFVRAGKEAGFNLTDDVNGFSQEGFGAFDMTVDHATGIRCSTSYGYLRPVMKDPSLQIFKETLVRKVIFDENSTSGNPKAIAVECENKKTGEIFTIKANKEIILSLGAVGSPHLLNLSGIGSPQELTALGIKTVMKNDFVGKNLQDHLEIYLQYLCDQKHQVSIFPYAVWNFQNPLHVLRRLAIGLQWFLNGTGICSSNLFETGGFIRSSNAKWITHPDVQLHFVPAIIQGQLDVLKLHGFQIHCGTLRPTSRGEVRVVSKEAKVSPEIDPNYLDSEQDKLDFRNAVKKSDNLIKQPSLGKYLHKNFRLEPRFDPNVVEDNLIDQWVQSFAESAYHLSCSCAMGSVVDEHGKVLGINNLRICDASIMPSMTSGNLNAPTIMMAEKISDNIIHGKYLLQPEENATWFDALKSDRIKAEEK